MKNSKENIEIRHRRLLGLLQREGYSNISEIAEKLGVTTATIRRDLEEFESKGMVKRYFGSVKCVLPPNKDVIYQTPTGNPSPLKTIIAKKAASMIEPNDVIFMNSSSTALAIVPFITSRCDIITNNARAIYAQHQSNVCVFLTGGEIYGNKQSLIGSFAVSALNTVTASKCFLGTSGISVSGGVTSTILQECDINRLMVERCSGSVIVVSEGKKIGAAHNFLSYNTDKVTHLITDSHADREELKKLEDIGITVILADA